MLIIGITMILAMILIALTPPHPTFAQEDNSGCLTCHDGLADIREEGNVMLATLKAKGLEAGDPSGCVICHGGDHTQEVQNLLIG